MGVIEMLEQIYNEGMSAGSYPAKAKDRKPGIRFMGFGHCVYRDFDPHARILKEAAHDLLESMSIDDPLFSITREVKEAMLADNYFAERRLYPNVNSYSGTILRAIGIPFDMFTVLSTVGCTAGWITHWKKANDDPAQCIYRLRQLYTDNELTKWLPLDER